MSVPPPASSSEQELLEEEYRRQHFRWRMVIVMPLVYIGAGLLIWRYWFLPERNGAGLLPMSDTIYWLALTAGALLVLVSWTLIRRTRQAAFSRMITEQVADETPRDVLRQHQLFQFALCDLVSLPGIVIFLLQGDPFPLVAFVGISFFFYLRILPSRGRLRAYFTALETGSKSEEE